MVSTVTVLKRRSFTTLDTRRVDLRSLTLRGARSENRKRAAKRTIQALNCARFYMQGPSWARAHTNSTTQGHKYAPPASSIAIDISRTCELALLPGILNALDPARATLKVSLSPNHRATDLLVPVPTSHPPSPAASPSIPPSSAPPQDLDINFYNDGTFLTTGLHSLEAVTVDLTDESSGDVGWGHGSKHAIDAASRYLGIEPPDENTIHESSLPWAASSLMATAFGRFKNVTNLRLAKMAFKSELMPSLLQMPNIRSLVINAEGYDQGASGGLLPIDPSSKLQVCYLSIDMPLCPLSTLVFVDS